MQSSKLQDKTGKYVPCVACGRHAGKSCLEDGAEVVTYFAAALEGLQGTPGQLWMYDLSHIVQLRRNCAMPPARTLDNYSKSVEVVFS